jgi:hypothetical protein
VNHDTSWVTPCRLPADRSGGTEDEKGRTMVENRISGKVKTRIFEPDHLE